MSLRATGMAVAVALLLLALGAPPATAQTLTLVDQERSVFGFVIVPQCGGDDAESESAPGFEPFNALASAALSCEAASGLASGHQRSLLGTESLRAQGQAASQAAAKQGNTIHAIADSLFEVEFTIEAPTLFTLEGRLRAAASANFILGGAQVRLTGPGGVVILDELVEPGPNGELTVLALDETGELEPGSYVLRATASSVIDNEVPPNRFMLASYRIIFDAIPASGNEALPHLAPTQ